MRVTGLLLGLIALAFLLAPTAEGQKGKGKGKGKGKLDPAKLIGDWNYVSGVKDGKKLSADDLKKGYVEISKEALKLKSEDAEFVLKYEIDVAKNPARIKLEIVKGPQGEGAKAEGIIAMKGENLVLCYPAMGGDAPKEFAAKEGSGLHLFVLKRKK
jgi:uncharacterized protein (TIGR03067 family)